MAEKLLNRPQIAPRRQQMGREAVAQAVGGGAVGQPGGGAPAAHLALDDARVEPSAARADEQRRIGLGRAAGPRGEVVVDRRPHQGQQRHHARLAALAGDAQHRVRAGLRQIADIEGERLADPQPGAVEKREQGHVAARDPGRGRKAAQPLDGRARVRDRERARHPAGAPGRPQRADGGVAHQAFAVEKAEEAAHRRDRARPRARRQPFARAAREPGAEVARSEARERVEIGRAAEMLAEEGEEGREIAPVGGAGPFGHPPLAGEPAVPVGDRRGEAGRGERRRPVAQRGRSSHRRRQCSSARARKA